MSTEQGKDSVVGVQAGNEVDELKKRVSGQDALVRKMLQKAGVNSVDEFMAKDASGSEKPARREAASANDDGAPVPPDEDDPKYLDDLGQFNKANFRRDSHDYQRSLAKWTVQQERQSELASGEDEALKAAVDALPAMLRPGDTDTDLLATAVRAVVHKRTGGRPGTAKDFAEAAKSVADYVERARVASLKADDDAAAERRAQEAPSAPGTARGVMPTSEPSIAELAMTDPEAAASKALRAIRAGTFAKPD